MIDEARAFQELQKSLGEQFDKIWVDDLQERTVVVLPSLTLDQEVLERITGVHHYEERLLSMLLLLRLPRTRVIFLSSVPISEVIIDYYMHLLPGVPSHHARSRLTMLCAHDSSSIPLTTKILNRPRLLARIIKAISDKQTAHLACFTVSGLERRLALELGIPIFGCDPDLSVLGSKSGGRKIMRKAGIQIPDGFEDLQDMQDVAEALYELKHRKPEMRRAVVKINEGFSGEGNAIFPFTDDKAPSVAEIKEALPGLAYEAKDMTWEVFNAKIEVMEAVVEEFIEGKEKRSPSAQFRAFPDGDVEIISTHDQVLGGTSGQIFLGCRFPADSAYRLTIQSEGFKVARCLRDQGVLGRFAVDFISVFEAGKWNHYGIEINIRKGGTTHPFLMLQFLIDGRYDLATGLYLTPGGRPCYYHATDNLEDPRYMGLLPDDLIDIAVVHDLHFHTTNQEGVMFHLIGALSEFGKLGAVCVGATRANAQKYYDETVKTLEIASRTG